MRIMKIRDARKDEYEVVISDIYETDDDLKATIGIVDDKIAQGKSPQLPFDVQFHLAGECFWMEGLVDYYDPMHDCSEGIFIMMIASGTK